MNFMYVVNNSSEAFKISTPSLIFSIALAIFMIVSMWKIFEKAGEPGWGAIVPFYSSYLEFKIAFGNGWYFLLLLIPIVNIVFSIMLPFKMAKAFGKGVGFGFGLLFLSIIFYPILAFGDAEYKNA